MTPDPRAGDPLTIQDPPEFRRRPTVPFEHRIPHPRYSAGYSAGFEDGLEDGYEAARPPVIIWLLIAAAIVMVGLIAFVAGWVARG